MRILSPCLIWLLNNLRDRAGAHGVAAFTNREPKALFKSYRCNQGYSATHVVPRHHHFHPCVQLHVSRHVRSAEVELWPVAREKRGVPSAFFLRQHVRFGLELGVWRDRARPSSSSFLNISTPVTTFFCVGRKPTISTSSAVFTLPRSILPVTTVPRPDIEKISSMGMANGRSTSRTGRGTFASTAAINSSIFFSHFSSPFNACSADPRITGTESPGN